MSFEDAFVGLNGVNIRQVLEIIARPRNPDLGLEPINIQHNRQSKEVWVEPFGNAYAIVQGQSFHLQPRDYYNLLSMHRFLLRWANLGGDLLPTIDWFFTYYMNSGCDGHGFLPSPSLHSRRIPVFTDPTTRAPFGRTLTVANVPHPGSNKRKSGRGQVSDIRSVHSASQPSSIKPADGTSWSGNPLHSAATHLYKMSMAK